MAACVPRGSTTGSAGPAFPQWRSVIFTPSTPIFFIGRDRASSTACKVCAPRSTTRAAVSRIIVAMEGARTRVSTARALFSAQRTIGMAALVAVFASLTIVAGPLEAAPGQSREAAARALAQPDVRGRRDAASRLGEIGTMADARALV